MKASFSTHKTLKTLTLNLIGNWEARHLFEVDASLRKLSVDPEVKLKLDFSEVKGLDTGGAWVLARFVRRLEHEGVVCAFSKLSDVHARILDQIDKYEVTVHREPVQQPNFLIAFLNFLGFRTTKMSFDTVKLVVFLGEVTTVLGKTILSPHRLRFKSFCSHLKKIGVDALPIVGLISFLIGIVLVYQGAQQLKRFGAEVFTVDLAAIAILREIGILLTAIVVAGRSGSAFTAQIGFMKLNQEVDAMRVIGMNPLEVLVIPRVLALVVSLPLLTFYSDIVALMGGALMCYTYIDLTFEQFIHQLQLAIKPWTFWTGMIKAPVFAFFIAFIGCFEGMRVAGGAESVGSQTTRAVVEAIFLVIVLDAAFSIIFSYIGI